MDERSIAAAGAEHLPPTGAQGSGGPAGDGGLADPRVLQILSTEHWSLLSARSLVYNEAFARAGMFLTFLSASLVALAFVASAMEFNRDFLVLAAMLLVFDIVIGLATLGRMLDASVDDLRSIAGMNRIRNAYVQIAPVVRPYFISSVYDDSIGVIETYGTPKIRSGMASFIHGMTTAGGMIMVIVALLAASLAGVLMLLIGADLGLTLSVGIAAFLILFVALNRYGYGVIRGFEATFETRFPRPPKAGA
jgi:hypothetical protein